MSEPTQMTVNVEAAQITEATLTITRDRRFCQIQPETILFDTASSFINTTVPQNIAVFQQVLNRLLSTPPGEWLLIVGHTDEVGRPTGAAGNDVLSQRRANAVLAVLEGDTSVWETIYHIERGRANAWDDNDFRVMLQTVRSATPTQSEIDDHRALTSAGGALRVTLFTDYFNRLLSSPFLMPTINTLVPAVLGCGERHTLGSGVHASSRRAEIFFFRGAASPTVHCDEYSKWLTACQNPPPAASTSLGDWENLISFRPPVTVQRSLQDRTLSSIDWPPHRIESAWGPINLDYYPVEIQQMPVISGQTMTPEQLVEHVRLNINSFIDTRISEFTPVDSSAAAKWRSAHPLGTVIHIDMKTLGGRLNPDDGSVVASEVISLSWIFSTIWTPTDMSHPVSGNRQFGIEHTHDGRTIFFTRGADRTTLLVDDALQSIVFSAAHSLWLSLQQGVRGFVNSHGGSARIRPAFSHRFSWGFIQPRYHHPTVPWI